MFIGDIPTQYVIENNSGCRVYASMNTEEATLAEASYMDSSFSYGAPHKVYRLDISVVKTHIPFTHDN